MVAFPNELNEQFKYFSDKHGAVLLGMHQELKTMQKSIDHSKQALKDAEDLNAIINSTFKEQHAAIAKEQKKLTALILQQDMSINKQFAAQRQEALQILLQQDMSIKKQFESQRQEALHHLNILAKKQLSIEQLYEKCFSLLSEHKQRDIELKNREVKVHQWMRRMEACTLICVMIALISLWYLIWRH